MQQPAIARSSAATRPGKAAIPANPGRAGEALGFAAFVGPGLLLYGMFVLFPLAHTVYLSFFQWDGVGAQVPVGFDNYLAIFRNGELAQAFVHSAVLIVIYLVGSVGLALVVAGLISPTAIGAARTYQMLLFLPQVVPSVVVGISWRWILAPEGLLNGLLATIGLGQLRRTWLGDFDTALIVLGIVGAWQLYGLFMLMFISGVQKISPNLYEAARLDGAGPVTEFIVITLPGLRREILMATMLAIIAAVSSFDLIYVMTKGGPGSSTTVPALEVYRHAFAYAAVGAGAAIGTVIALIVLFVVWLVGRIRSFEDRSAAR